MIKVGIVGATGYTGCELLRILLSHKQVEISAVTARTEAGKKISEIFPNFYGKTDLKFIAPENAALEKCDVVFFATPHGVCMQYAQKLLSAGVKIIDLSADFRIKDIEKFKQWYGIEHCATELLSQAVYGLVENNRTAIKNANLVANPGCYPTAVQLGFKPLLIQNLVEDYPLIADVKSGISGAGRSAKLANLLAENAESFKAYALNGHRHQIEIEQELSRLSGKDVSIVFTPHLIPIIRGIEATLYAKLKDKNTKTEDIHDLYTQIYKNEQFVEILPLGITPEIRSVKASNNVQIGIFRSPDQKTIIISVVEDNLVKGAAGQAVQSMNLMFNLNENEALNNLAVLP